MLKRILIAVAGVLGGLVAAILLVFVAPRNRTPVIQDAMGRRVPASIARLERVRLGGLDQVVLLRGADTTRPVILFLHGGPGMPSMYLAHAFQRPLEHDFVVVQWDRRGAGKSWAAREPLESLTVRRVQADLYELTQLLRARFHQDRIVLVAHSWGTAIGLAAVRDHPEWYRAYVGMGQLVPDTARAHVVRAQLVRARARAMRDTALLARLAGPGAQPTEDDVFSVGGELRGATSIWPLLATGFRAPEYTLFDAWNVRRGSQLLLRRMRGDPLATLPGPGDTLRVPIFLFLGRDDYNTPSSVAAEYLQALLAPLKQVVWFERSAHFPFFEEPDRFHAEMVRVDSAAAAFWRGP